MRRPTVSVLTPVFNEEAFLGDMIRSLQEQPYAGWELVVVDDGSTDRTVDIVSGLAAADPRIRLVHQGVRLGKVAAFNLAFTHARGDIICHIGGDDLATADALTARVEALGDLAGQLAVAYFKLQIMDGSDGDGPIVPRGTAGSRSGPSTTLTAPLAKLVFPVPEDLPSEDLWIGEAALGLAERVVHRPEVVTRYRVHAGNSNPRAKSFEQMTQSIGARMRYVPGLLAESRFALHEPVRAQLQRDWEAEQLRAAGATWKVLRADLPLTDRLAVASMSNRWLWRLRQRGGALLSGRRGR